MLSFKGIDAQRKNIQKITTPQEFLLMNLLVSKGPARPKAERLPAGGKTAIAYLTVSE